MTTASSIREPAEAQDNFSSLAKSDCCSVCGNVDGNKTLVAREMFFGYRDQFEYRECGRCGYLEIKEVPKNLSRYYPPEYQVAPPELKPESGLKRFLRRQRAEYCLHGANFIGKWLVKKFGRPESVIFGRPDHYSWLSKCKLNFDSSILEIGCGSGHLLVNLREDGFTDLTGVDPLIKEPINYPNGVKILKTDIYQVDRQFDFIMLHHTFEHMPDHPSVLKQIYRPLKPGGFVVIRIPVASSFAYRKYGVNWVQLDPPRHLSLHTERSFHLLTARAGFEIAGITYDSHDFQFWASEQYVMDISLRDNRSYMINPDNSIFSRSQIREFRRVAEALNAANDGDSACFYLRKP